MKKAKKDIFSITGHTTNNPLKIDNLNNYDFMVSGKDCYPINNRKVEYIADPFVFTHKGKEYLFFETFMNSSVKKHITKGAIGVLEREKNFSAWSKFSIAIEEKYHLSYPQVVSTEHGIYMIVESSAAGEVRLYKAKGDMCRWIFHDTLLKGEYFDPTLFVEKSGNYYLFVSERSGLYFDKARLFVSSCSIFGNWFEHPCSPIIENNPRAARAAGPVMEWRGKYYRLAQDCSRRYGESVIAHEILEITPNKYREKETGVLLSASGKGWNSHGMHHLQIYKRNTNCVKVVCDGYARVVL